MAQWIEHFASDEGVGGSNPSGCTVNIMLLIDKPVGISSFAIVAHVRRVTGVKKVGHAGTLDPLASGLMLILVGREETKQAAKLLGLDKVYKTTVRIGEERDTGDLEGKMVAHATNLDSVTRETLERDIKQALETMTGINKLPVPAYSAIKQDGQRLYKKARKDQEIILPIRDMYVCSARLLSLTRVTIRDIVMYEADIEFSVASGVYIRSLSEELGRRVGYPATTAKLRRISIAEYSIKDAQVLDEVNNNNELIHHEINV